MKDKKKKSVKTTHDSFDINCDNCGISINKTVFIDSNTCMDCFIGSMDDENNDIDWDDVPGFKG